MKVEDNGKSISNLLTEMIAKIGENLIINDLKVFDNQEAKVSYYIHNPYRKNIGKIVSALLYSSEEENDEVKIAMSEWDNKVLIRSIGTNSYYLKFAIMGLLSYILDNEIPKVWNS